MFLAANSFNTRLDTLLLSRFLTNCGAATRTTLCALPQANASSTLPGWRLCSWGGVSVEKSENFMIAIHDKDNGREALFSDFLYTAPLLFFGISHLLCFCFQFYSVLAACLAGGGKFIHWRLSSGFNRYWVLALHIPLLATFTITNTHIHIQRQTLHLPFFGRTPHSRVMNIYLHKRDSMQFILANKNTWHRVELVGAAADCQHPACTSVFRSSTVHSFLPFHLFLCYCCCCYWQFLCFYLISFYFNNFAIFLCRIVCGIYCCAYFLVTAKFQEQLTSGITAKTSKTNTTAMHTTRVTHTHTYRYKYELNNAKTMVSADLRRLKRTLQHLRRCQRNQSHLSISIQTHINFNALPLSSSQAIIVLLHKNVGGICLIC